MAGVRASVVNVAAAVICLLLGAMAALFGAFIHPGVRVVLDVAWPVGLALALALEALSLRLAAGVGGRVGVWFTGGAWIAVVLVLTWPRAAGDVVVPGTWYGYAFLILGMGLAMVAATLAWLRSAVQVPASASAIAPERR